MIREDFYRYCGFSKREEKEYEEFTKKKEEIKQLITDNVLSQIQDKTIRLIVEQILFSSKSTINWDNALKIVKEYITDLAI